jgi:hypothetical protein
MRTLLPAALGCALLGGCGTPAPTDTAAAATDRQIYEWRIYTLAPEADAARLDDFFRDALIPACNEQGIEIGAFAPAEAYPEFPAGARYLFLAYPDLETFRTVSRAVREDAGFLAAAAGYFDASAPEPVYTNLETYLCEAFDGIPQLRRPAPERGLFEFRVYRSPNMEANERKIPRFQSGETEIFDQVGIHAVCFGRTLAGGRMPSLTYLTWYGDRQARDQAWERFRAHPEWARLRGLPEFAHTATDNTVRLLVPLSYSQY